MLDLLLTTMALSAPLVLAAIGGFASERGGVVNIGLEGLMLTACCVVAIVSPGYGPVAGLAAGILAATILSLLHWVATQIYRVDHVISGMAINLLAAGGTNFAYGRYTGPSSSFPHFPVAAYAALAALAPVLAWAVTRFTRPGLRLVAVGADPDKARMAGIDPIRVRLIGLIVTGGCTGLAGACLISYAGTFTDDMTDGRGYIALAALILGGWRPVPSFIACLAFGFLTALRIKFQGTPVFGVNLPSQAWSALPFLATLVALAGFLGRNRTPAGLGKP